MKKIISILLSVLMVVSCVSVGFAAETSEPDLKFAVASDLHYNVPREELEGNPSQPIEIDHPIYWYANRRAAMEDESGFIIDEFLRQCAEDDSIEYVLIPGDLADNGRVIVEEHLAVAEKFKAFEEATGKSVFVIKVQIYRLQRESVLDHTQRHGHHIIQTLGHRLFLCCKTGRSRTFIIQNDMGSHIPVI